MTAEVVKNKKNLYYYLKRSWLIKMWTYLWFIDVSHVHDGHAHVDAHRKRDQHREEEQQRLRMPHA